MLAVLEGEVVLLSGNLCWNCLMVFGHLAVETLCVHCHVFHSIIWKWSCNRPVPNNILVFLVLLGLGMSDILLSADECGSRMVL